MKNKEAKQLRLSSRSLAFILSLLALTLAGCQQNNASSVASSEAPASTSENSDSASIPAPSPSDAPLQVYALEQTGQYGDCTLFKEGNYEILIDGGNQSSAPQLAKALNSYVTDHVLDLLIVTHPHADHYGGFTYGQTPASQGGSLVDGGVTSVGKIVDSGIDTTSVSSYGSYFVKGFRNYWVNKGAEYYAIANLVENHTNDAIWNLTSHLSVQWLDTTHYSPAGGYISSGDANDYSVTCNLRFGSYDFFMAGDLPSGPEDDLVAKYRNNSFLKAGNQMIFKACHHGSAGSNDYTLISFLKPAYAWASAGIISDNVTSSGPQKSQHPFKSARDRIEASTGKDKMWWNGTAGTLEMSIPNDYSSFSIKGVGREYADYYDRSGALVDRVSEKEVPLESTKWAALNF